MTDVAGPPLASASAARAAGSTVARRSWRCMGTVASLHVHEPVPTSVVDAAQAAVAGELERLEQLFSTFRPTSDIGRINRGALDLLDAGPEVLDVLDACTWLEAASGRAFRVWRPTGDGGEALDPAGFVKGWAAERAAAALDAAGLTRWYLSVGGDLLVRGRPVDGRPWRIAVADPRRPGGVLDVVEVDPVGSGCRAVATSGTGERGAHVWDGRDGRPATALAQITVVGPTLTWADALATAALAMGDDGPAWVAGFDGHGALAVRADGLVARTGTLA